MNLTYEFITDDQIEYCRDLCNELMIFQKSKAYIKSELFDSMDFDTRHQSVDQNDVFRSPGTISSMSLFGRHS